MLSYTNMQQNGCLADSFAIDLSVYMIANLPATIQAL